MLWALSRLMHYHTAHGQCLMNLSEDDHMVSGNFLNGNNHCPSCFTRLLQGLNKTVQGSTLYRFIQHMLFSAGTAWSTGWQTAKAHTISSYYEAGVRK